jgi:hypothetical protein
MFLPCIAVRDDSPGIGTAGLGVGRSEEYGARIESNSASGDRGRMTGSAR